MYICFKDIQPSIRNTPPRIEREPVTGNGLKRPTEIRDGDAPCFVRATSSDVVRQERGDTENDLPRTRTREKVDRLPAVPPTDRPEVCKEVSVTH